MENDFAMVDITPEVLFDMFNFKAKDKVYTFKFLDIYNSKKKWTKRTQYAKPEVSYMIFNAIPTEDDKLLGVKKGELCKLHMAASSFSKQLVSACKQQYGYELNKNPPKQIDLTISFTRLTKKKFKIWDIQLDPTNHW